MNQESRIEKKPQPKLKLPIRDLTPRKDVGNGTVNITNSTIAGAGLYGGGILQQRQN